PRPAGPPPLCPPCPCAPMPDPPRPPGPPGLPGPPDPPDLLELGLDDPELHEEAAEIVEPALRDDAAVLQPEHERARRRGPLARRREPEKRAVLRCADREHQDGLLILHVDDDVVNVGDDL